jgi:hypothetical protein
MNKNNKIMRYGVTAHNRPVYASPPKRRKQPERCNLTSIFFKCTG